MRKVTFSLVCCTVAAAFPLSCSAQVFGGLYSSRSTSSLAAGVQDRMIANWLMTLPLDDNPAQPAEAQMACCRFRGHRDWVFHEAGGGRCRDGSSVESSRSRRFGSFVTAMSALPRRHGDLDVHENVLRRFRPFARHAAFMLHDGSAFLAIRRIEVGRERRDLQDLLNLNLPRTRRIDQFWWQYNASGAG